jgi:hypothetical protein
MSKFCEHAKSDMTPCVRRDGAVAFAMDMADQPICVGCERTPAQLGVERPADWEQTVKDYNAKH